MSDVTHEQQGPLGAIADRAAAKEIGKLWNLLQSRFPPPTAKMPDHAVVTHSDLNLLRQDITRRLDRVAIPKPPQVQTIGGGSSGSARLANVSSLTIMKSAADPAANALAIVAQPATAGAYTAGIAMGTADTAALTLNVGLDMGRANILTAAIIVPEGAPIVLSPTAAALIRYRGGKFTLESGGVPKFSVDTDGFLSCNAGSIRRLEVNTILIAAPGGSATAGPLMGYFDLNLGGFMRKVPFYAAS